MIERLRIENLALVGPVELEFGAGLNVLTGETGAGKSIVLGALGLLGGGGARGGPPRRGGSRGGSRPSSTAISTPRSILGWWRGI